MQLDAERIKSEFNERGFTLIENFLSEDEIKEMKTAMHQIVDDMKPEDHPTCIFVTEDEDQHASDTYFMDSSDKIRFFYEDGAVDKKTGKLIVDKHVACNKVGHGLHWFNPAFKKVSFSDKIKILMKALDYRAPAIVQGMYIFKQPRIGGSVTGHYDGTFLAADPIDGSMGLWFALDDATEENGCLWFSPGSHKDNDGSYRFIRTFDSGPGARLLKFRGEKPDFDSKDYVPVPVKKDVLGNMGCCLHFGQHRLSATKPCGLGFETEFGTHNRGVVAIHGLAWHKSYPNTSDKQRHAFTLHLMETDNVTWSKENWLQETDTYKFPKLYDN